MISREEKGRFLCHIGRVLSLVHIDQNQRCRPHKPRNKSPGIRSTLRGLWEKPIRRQNRDRKPAPLLDDSSDDRRGA